MIRVAQHDHQFFQLYGHFQYNLSWCYIENGQKIERTEGLKTQIITWTHFTNTFIRGLELFNVYYMILKPFMEIFSNESERDTQSFHLKTKKWQNCTVVNMRTRKWSWIFLESTAKFRYCEKATRFENKSPWYHIGTSKQQSGLFF